MLPVTVVARPKPATTFSDEDSDEDEESSMFLNPAKHTAMPAASTTATAGAPAATTTTITPAYSAGLTKSTSKESMNFSDMSDLDSDIAIPPPPPASRPAAPPPSE